MLPYFKRCEDNSRGLSAWRGVGGPLIVSDLADPNPLSRAFVEAAVKVGIPRNDDYNGATQDGVSLVQVNIQKARRCSAADAYLSPVLGRSNLTVITGAHASRIICEGQRVFCGNHVTLGKGGANTCLSVHWARDDAGKRLLLGWIGRHRTNTLS